jgi:hypothetical protein
MLSESKYIMSVSQIVTELSECENAKAYVRSINNRLDPRIQVRKILLNDFKKWFAETADSINELAVTVPKLLMRPQQHKIDALIKASYWDANPDEYLSDFFDTLNEFGISSFLDTKSNQVFLIWSGNNDKFTCNFTFNEKDVGAYVEHLQQDKHKPAVVLERIQNYVRLILIGTLGTLGTHVENKSFWVNDKDINIPKEQVYIQQSDCSSKLVSQMIDIPITKFGRSLVYKDLSKRLTISASSLKEIVEFNQMFGIQTVLTITDDLLMCLPQKGSTCIVISKVNDMKDLFNDLIKIKDNDKRTVELLSELI